MKEASASNKTYDYLLPVYKGEGEIAFSKDEILCIAALKNTHNDKIWHLTENRAVIDRNINIRELKKKTPPMVQINKSVLIAKKTRVRVIKGYVILPEVMIKNKPFTTRLSRLYKKAFYRQYAR
jgi:hypothetical protein